LIALLEYFDFALPLAKCELFQKGEGLHTSTIVIANVICAEFVFANQSAAITSYIDNFSGVT